MAPLGGPARWIDVATMPRSVPPRPARVTLPPIELQVTVPHPMDGSTGALAPTVTLEQVEALVARQVACAVANLTDVLGLPVEIRGILVHLANYPNDAVTLHALCDWLEDHRGGGK